MYDGTGYGLSADDRRGRTDRESARVIADEYVLAIELGTHRAIDNIHPCRVRCAVDTKALKTGDLNIGGGDIRPAREDNRDIDPKRLPEVDGHGRYLHVDG